MAEHDGFIGRLIDGRYRIERLAGEGGWCLFEPILNALAHATAEATRAGRQTPRSLRASDSAATG